MDSWGQLHLERCVWIRWGDQCNASDLQSVPVPEQHRREGNQEGLSAATRTSDGRCPRGSRVGSGEVRGEHEQGGGGGRDGMQGSRRSVSRVHCRAGTRPTKKASGLMGMVNEDRRELGEA